MSDLVKEQHWRDKWPLGHVDAADTEAEAEVLEQFTNPPAPKIKPPTPVEKYAWSYDEEVLHTG